MFIDLYVECKYSDSSLASTVRQQHDTVPGTSTVVLHRCKIYFKIPIEIS